METPNTPAAPASTSPAPVPVSGGQPLGQASSAPSGGGEPAWKTKFKSDEELWNAYGSLEKKLGEQGNQLGQYRQALEQYAGQAGEYERAVQAWDQWFKSTGLADSWGDVQKFLQTKQGRQAVAQTAQQLGVSQQAGSPDWAADWDTLAPGQQAQRLREVALTEIASALTPAITNWQRQFMGQYQQDLEQREKYYQNYLNLYRRVMDMRMRDPNLDVDKVLDQAIGVLSGNMDPIELGKYLATAGSNTQAQIKAAVEQARKDWDTEQQNKTMASLDPKNGQPPAFRRPSAGTTRAGLATMREGVAQQIMEKHGPGVF